MDHEGGGNLTFNRFYLLVFTHELGHDPYISNCFSSSSVKHKLMTDPVAFDSISALHPSFGHELCHELPHK